MFIRDGIAYADTSYVRVSVKNVRALDDYTLLITFSNGEKKTFDFKPLLGFPCFIPLRDKGLFRSAYVDYGTVAWNEEIDIAPEALYENGVLVP